MSESVKVWEERITLPTYVPPSPDLNPMFLEKRVNQGTSGRVYPNPFLDQLASESEPREYQAVYLENAYIRLMMLPEIGGRIHEGVDKSTGYHFIYRQHVIKPALIGLFGSWISGGVEFNWPQHHRPSTFMPTQYLVEEGEDGSVTVWFSEHDPMQRMKGMVGICLYPDRAFFEMKVRLFNRTPEVQTFLWWINVGVHVHEDYQVVFPPDVTVVTDHSKRAMSHYPIAYGTYYGIDYSNQGAGTDLSWVKNIPVPTSYFVWETGYDFFGGYDHRAQAGIVHVANRYIAPGKKMFTWGNGEFARGWEANLTDDDGPYIELMAGVYTDNQPDFSWLQPYETKVFSQYWYPIQRIGPPKNANQRAALNLEVEDGRARIGVAVTEALPSAGITLRAAGERVFATARDLLPGQPLVVEVPLPAGVEETDLLLRVVDAQGHEVIRYAPQQVERPELPEPKTPPPPPETFDSIEELYLTGLHLEQYRHPTIEPEPYWEAALARDPDDVRSNNAMGLVYYRRGQFDRAITHFQRAIDRLTQRNPNPRDGEPFYNLGLARRMQGDREGAYGAFYKAIWSYAWQAAGYYALAELDGWRGDFEQALDHLTRALMTNASNAKARDLKAAVLRRLGRLDEAEAAVQETLQLDPLDTWARNEAVWIARARGDEGEAAERLRALRELMHVPHALSEIQAHLDMAFDYANAGFWREARDVLSRLVDEESGAAFPMVLYAMGYFSEQLGDHGEAQALYRRGSAMPTDYCFPVRLEEMLILEHIQSLYPDDGRVAGRIAYYLGNLYYDKKRYDEAIANWERATELEPDFSIPWRNLGIAYYNVRHDATRALTCYERALALNPQDGRILSEYDQLRMRTGVTPEERLALLTQHMALVRARDDLSVELATLYNLTGQPQQALDYLLSRRFHPWEGGTGRVSRQYVQAHLLLGQEALAAGDAQTALQHFETAQATYPENLGERKHLLWPDADVQYYTGLARQALGDEAGAAESFARVLEARGSAASEVSYYKALALRAMGREKEAVALLNAMTRSAKIRLAEQAQQGFATSVPEFVFAESDLETRRRAQLTYILGLAHLGRGELDEARAAFEQVRATVPGHTGAWLRLRELDRS